MGISYYLLSSMNRIALPLGKRDHARSDVYDGPVVWINSERRYLPPDHLILLQNRFKQKHDDAQVVADYELYNIAGVVGDCDDEIVILGGDRDWDLPLTTYFPELATHEIRAEILSNGRPIE